jgi:hypothetical protein
MMFQAPASFAPSARALGVTLRVCRAQTFDRNRAIDEFAVAEHVGQRLGHRIDRHIDARDPVMPDAVAQVRLRETHEAQRGFCQAMVLGHVSIVVLIDASGQAFQFAVLKRSRDGLRADAGVFQIAGSHHGLGRKHMAKLVALGSPERWHVIKPLRINDPVSGFVTSHSRSKLDPELGIVTSVRTGMARPVRREA